MAMIPTTQSPTEAEIAAINARHLVETPLRPADLLFVFGTREDVDLRVEEACRLWREGFFRWAVVSGGVTPGSDRSECEIIADAEFSRRMLHEWRKIEPYKARGFIAEWP